MLQTVYKEELSAIQMSDTVQLALDIGEQILICGGEISRVEDTVTRICSAYGAVRTDVFAITSAVFVTAIWKDSTVITQSRRIRKSAKNMYRLERLNMLSREICAKQLPIPEAEQIFSAIMEQKGLALKRWWLGSVLAAASYTAFFGGSWKDCLTAPIVATVIFVAQQLSERLEANRFLSHLLCSFFATAAAILGTVLCLGDSVNQIMTGCIMILIPGISFTGAIENLLIGDTISGLLAFLEAVMIALALAGGFALSILLMGGLLA